MLFTYKNASRREMFISLKFEIRNPKHETNGKFKGEMHKTSGKGFS